MGELPVYVCTMHMKYITPSIRHAVYDGGRSLTNATTVSQLTSHEFTQ